MTPSGRSDPCAACGKCCRSYIVPVYGHDLYRLVVRRGLDPRRFVFFARQFDPGPEGVLFWSGGPAFGIVLDKKEEREVNRPCVFLTEYEDGTSGCGVYEDRPIVCSTYPMARGPDGIRVLPTALCPPGSWEEDEGSKPSWARFLGRFRRYAATYAEVVNRWNARIDRGWGTQREPEEYVAYVMQVYEKLTAAERELGAEQLDVLDGAWGTMPPGAPAAGTREVEPAWLAHHRQARSIIDGFFPEVPPLPFRRITVRT